MNHMNYPVYHLAEDMRRKEEIQLLEGAVVLSAAWLVLLEAGGKAGLVG